VRIRRRSGIPVWEARKTWRSWRISSEESASQSDNKQLERTVVRNRVRAVGAPFHYAPTARWTALRAAAQLRRYAARCMRGLILFLLLVPGIGSAQERIIGLIEIPAIHAAVNEGRADIAAVPVTVRTEPNGNSAVAVTVQDWRQFESREHGYEQVSAAAYARTYAPSGGLWYKVRFTVGDKTGYGWVQHSDGAQYREVHSLVSSGLAFLTDAWDRRLFERPVVEGSARTLERTDPSDAVRVIDVYYERGRSEPWFLLAVVRGQCTGEPLEILATGWVPAYAPDGQNTVWFHSRGC